jgi:hypothetical protein
VDYQRRSLGEVLNRFEQAGCASDHRAIIVRAAYNADRVPSATHCSFLS